MEILSPHCWTWDDGAFTWTVEALAAEPGCPAAAELAGSSWSGRVDEHWIVEGLRLSPTSSGQVAGDLLAELGDSLQRLVVPIPDGRLRPGAVWGLRVHEEASGLRGDIADRWTATPDGKAVRIAWEEEALLTAADAGDVQTQPTVERWSGELVLEPGALLASGRWTSERPLRIVGDGRWVESTARCSGELLSATSEGVSR